MRTLMIAAAFAAVLGNVASAEGPPAPDRPTQTPRSDARVDLAVAGDVVSRPADKSVVVTGAGNATSQPNIAPGAYSSFTAQITAVGQDSLTLHVLRGHSGIIKTYRIDPKAEVILPENKPGKLSDLKPGQWVRVHWKWIDAEHKESVIIRVEPSATQGGESSRLTLTPSKASFAVGEQIDLELRLTNAGEEDIAVDPAKVRFLSGMKVIGPDGQPVPPAINGVEINPGQRPPERVKHGATYSATLSGINLEKPGGRFVRHIRFPMDQPGIYTVSMTVGGVTGQTEVRVGVPAPATQLATGESLRRPATAQVKDGRGAPAG